MTGGANAVRADTTEKQRVGINIARFNPVDAFAEVVGKTAVIAGCVGIRDEHDVTPRGQVTTLVDMLLFGLGKTVAENNYRTPTGARADEVVGAREVNVRGQCGSLRAGNADGLPRGEKWPVCRGIGRGRERKNSQAQAKPQKRTWRKEQMAFHSPQTVR